MRIRGVIWKLAFIEKMLLKHHVTTDEVEDVIFGRPHVLRAEKGKVQGENVYEAFGQTADGRHLVVFFVNKSGAALPISARDMTDSERRYYEKHKT
ncbi:BrnT family toxin [Candidatus Sumerlaeota bacterium]|nr:BrnT family toxin [Candidatus Sumerlaeota bacterium]